MKQFFINHEKIIFALAIIGIIGITGLLTFIMDKTSSTKKASQPKTVDITKLSKKDGHIYILDVVLDSKGKPTTGIDAIITFNTNDVKYIDFRPTFAISDAFVNYNTNIPGVIRLRAIDTNNKPLNKKATIGRLVFQGNLRGSYSIQLSSLQAASEISLFPKKPSPLSFSLVSEIDNINLALTKDTPSTVNTLSAPSTVPAKIGYIDIINCIKNQKVCTPTIHSQADLNSDGIVNNDDLNVFLKQR